LMKLEKILQLNIAAHLADTSGVERQNE
jgi:hypothetical protein